MTRLAVIGNSHVAAFREGWALVAAEHPGTTLAFFALPNAHLGRLALDAERRLSLPEASEARLREAAMAINGRLSIELGSADHVLWVGYYWPFEALAKLTAEFSIDGLRETGGAPRALSRPAFDAVCDGLAEAVLPGAAWRGWVAPGLTVNARALPAETCLGDARPALRYWRAAARAPEGVGAVAGTFLDRFERQLGAQGIGLLRQPQETLAASGLTAAGFSRGSHRLMSGAAHPESDHLHMNARYGALCLRRLLARLAPARAAGAAAI